MSDVIDFDARPKATEGEGTGEVPIFTIDGKTYSIPNKARVNLLLRMAKDAEETNEMVASMKLVERLVGKEGYEALTSYDDLTIDDLNAVIEAVMKVTMGELVDQVNESE